MQAAVIVFPGSNRDVDMIAALGRAMGKPPLEVWHAEPDLPATDLIVVPGGFSYGDYLRAGAMAATSPVMRVVVERARKGVAVLGVCNGFQVLCEVGLLPGALLRNASLKFVCKQVYLRIERSDTPFARGYNAGSVIQVPVAHHDGNYFCDDETLARLEGDGLVAVRYCTADGTLDGSANPNGSRAHIAGIYSDDLRVLGMMPHPEDATDPLHFTQDGVGLFAGLAEALS